MDVVQFQFCKRKFWKCVHSNQFLTAFYWMRFKKSNLLLTGKSFHIFELEKDVNSYTV